MMSPTTTNISGLSDFEILNQIVDSLAEFDKDTLRNCKRSRFEMENGGGPISYRYDAFDICNQEESHRPVAPTSENRRKLQKEVALLKKKCKKISNDLWASFKKIGRRFERLKCRTEGDEHRYERLHAKLVKLNQTNDELSELIVVLEDFVNME